MSLRGQSERCVAQIDPPCRCRCHYFHLSTRRLEVLTAEMLSVVLLAAGERHDKAQRRAMDRYSKKLT